MANDASLFWDKRIAVEDVRGVPFRMYVERPKSIGDMLVFAERWGDRPYVIQGNRTITFSDLLRASGRKAAALLESGVKPGDRVMILGWNSVDWVLNFWACVRVGAVPVAGNTWWSEAEVEDALVLMQPALVLADASGSKKVGSGWTRGVWTVDDSELADVAFHPPVMGADENAPAAIIFTSGTSGKAKAVVLAHRSILSQLLMLMHVTRRLPYNPAESAGEVSLHTGPLFHIGGVQGLVRGVTLGNTFVLLEGRFDPADAVRLIETYRISRWNAVPTMATRLLEYAKEAKADISSLTNVTLGGSAVHPELMDQIRNGLPGAAARVATGYGLSENAGQATAAGTADTVSHPGSTGRPLPLVELKTVPREGLPDGEVLVRSPTQMLGYFGDVESPLDGEGWLHTGDLGRIDEDGRLWITGRCKDIIIRGGENISPAAVERALLTLPGVVEAVVFGTPHAELGEEVMAVVVVEGDATAESLRDQMRSRVASFAVPSRWRLQTEALPTNQTGKVDKAAVVRSIVDA